VLYVAMESKENLQSEIPELRRDIRRQLATSSGKKEGHSEGGTKRKSCGSLDVSSMCQFCIVIPSFNVLLSLLNQSTFEVFLLSKHTWWATRLSLHFHRPSAIYLIYSFPFTK